MILLTNDDGIDAEGLAALLRAARRIGDAVAVAPLVAHSGAGHGVTTNRALRVEERSEARFAVAGTPADCVRLALHQLVPAAECVLAGINHGGNLGADVYYSGTVAAAREAALHGRPAIAFSYLRHKSRGLDWDRATVWAYAVLADLLARPWTPGCFYNVNFPNLKSGALDPEIVFCSLDPNPLPLAFRSEPEGVSYAGDYYSRKHCPDQDVDLCFRGKITVTAIRLREAA